MRQRFAHVLDCCFPSVWSLLDFIFLRNFVFALWGLFWQVLHMTSVFLPKLACFQFSLASWARLSPRNLISIGDGDAERAASLRLQACQIWITRFTSLTAELHLQAPERKGSFGEILRSHSLRVGFGNGNLIRWGKTTRQISLKLSFWILLETAEECDGESISSSKRIKQCLRWSSSSFRHVSNW